MLGDVDLLFAVMLVLNRAKVEGQANVAVGRPLGRPRKASTAPRNMERILEGVRRWWAIGNSPDIKEWIGIGQ